MSTAADPLQIETAALATALWDYAQQSDPDDFSSLTRFVDTYPTSSWNAALLTNLGIEYHNRGYYSKALEVWSQAWELAKDITELKGKAIADRAVGELAYLYGRLGRIAELDVLLESVKGRAFGGPATEKIVGSREGLVMMKTRPEICFRCGPLALHRIQLAVNPENSHSDIIDATESPQQGFSLCQVAKLSHQLGLDFQMAFRHHGAEVVIPSVIHLKLNHFAAIIRCEGDRYLLQDPTFKKDVWVTRKALDTEASGYFLIPGGELPESWRKVEDAEAKTVFGKGNVPNPPEPPGPCDASTDGCTPCPNKGMAVAKILLLNASLNISDEPVGYSPPVGSAVRFTVRYNQRDDQFSSNFNYSNFGNKWTFDWLAYIKDDPSNPLADVKYYIMGGGNRTFTGFNTATQTYTFQLLDQTKLTRTSPTSYEMLSRDGSKKVFSQPDGAVGGTTRKVFLTQVIDPFGNTVSLTYDANLRVISITDAIGQVTTLSYNLPADSFKITKVTDPFGRFATFEYDVSNRLVKITDVIGLTSELTYDADGAGGTKSDFITALTTPYGVTKFTKGENGTTRSLEILYPDGERERVEFDQNLRIPASDPPESVPRGMATRNELLAYRNTYHWDRQGCAYAYGDYSKARVYHWLHSTDLQSPVGILESFKEPLESRVWYGYTGQSSPNGPIVIGNSSKPIRVGRVLDDGSSQLYIYEYNDFGNVTKTIDPVGRTFSYLYANNGIDLLETRQTRASQNELLSQVTYNSQHLPLTSKDAAGQITTYTYNARGQVLSQTNAKNEITTYSYDANGYLTSINGPLPGASITSTYDSIGRVQTKTDDSGYTLTFSYDALDRQTRVTYPDSTFDQSTYNRLDLTVIRDRAGRQTTREYNNVRQKVKETDPLNRTTLYQWCKCGDLKSLTDPLGRTTIWRHDVQGRVKWKEYTDGSKVIYLYDNASRLRQRIDEKFQVTQYVYNLDDSLRQISYTNAVVATPSVTFTYDANYNRLTSMTDGTGITRYGYIPISPVPSLGAGQLSSVDGPIANDTITYTYDELGRRISTAINGVASSLTYDAGGRIITNSNALGTFNTSYDGNSFRKVSQTYPNGQTTEFSYAGNLQDQCLQKITHKLGNTPISEFIYGYDVPTGQITSWSQQVDTQTPLVYDFAYDTVDQLLSASVSEGGNVVKTFGYSYDLASNRLTEQIDATLRQFSYNALNELTSVEGDASPSVTYQWDAEQRLISVSSGNQETLFTYDGLGRRVGICQLMNGTEVSNRRFVWCDSEICEERDLTGTVLKQYSPQGMKLEAGATTGNFYYTRDHLGSVRELTDSAGNVETLYSYDPFGRQSRLMGNLESDFRFAGMFWSIETNLNLTIFRVYDPEIGRWLSRDPLDNVEVAEGSNLFAYVQNNPVNRIDPFGLEQTQADGRTRAEACRRAIAKLSSCTTKHCECFEGGGMDRYTCIARCESPPPPPPPPSPPNC